MIYRTGAVGDTVLLSSVIQSIKTSIPHAEIELLGIQERMELLVGDGFADRARSAETLRLETLFGTGPIDAGLTAYLSQFDIIVWYSSAGEILHRRLQVRPDQRIFPWPALPPEESMDHITQHYHRAIESILPIKNPPIPRLPLDEQEIHSMKIHLAEKGIVFYNHFVLALHVGAGSPKKIAPFPQIYELLQNQTQNLQLQIVLIQGPADEEAVNGFLCHIPLDKTYALFSNPSLAALTAFLSLADAYIGNDSGVSHIAAAVGCPSLVHFVSSNPHLWRPLGDHVHLRFA